MLFQRDGHHVTTKNWQQLLGNLRNCFRHYANGSVNANANKAAAALEAALESDINFIDSADMYGDGKSELVFAAAMKEAGISRDQFYSIKGRNRHW